MSDAASPRAPSAHPGSAADQAAASLYGPHRLPATPWRQEDMWRYRALLPVHGGPIRYPLKIGGTPLVRPPLLSSKYGLERLWLKDETRGPSGSNKDRATALVLEKALVSGIRTVSCASTGNVAASLSVGCAAVGIQAVVFVPVDVRPVKLAVMLAAGAQVLRVRQGYEAAFELSCTAARTFGWLDRNTGVNPDTVEAKKTAAFEIWEQLGRRFPDVVVLPVGDGVTLCAMARGFEELRACGADGPMPRLIGVQAQGCQPVKTAWESGDQIRKVDPATIADGIAVGEPVFGIAAIDHVRRSNGAFVAVSDPEILDASSALARSAGIIAEPAGAATTAGLVAALGARLIDPAETVVVHVTGSGFKAPEHLRPLRNAPVDIDASLDEVAGTLGLGRPGLR